MRYACIDVWMLTGVRATCTEYGPFGEDDELEKLEKLEEHRKSPFYDGEDDEGDGEKKRLVD